MPFTQRQLSPRLRAFTIVCLLLGVGIGFASALVFTREHWSGTNHIALILWLVTFLLPALAFIVERFQPLRTTVLAYVALLASFGLLDRLSGK